MVQTNGKLGGDDTIADSGLIATPEINVQKLKAIDDEVTTALDSNQEHWHKGGRVLDAVIVSTVCMMRLLICHCLLLITKLEIAITETICCQGSWCTHISSIQFGKAGIYICFRTWRSR